MDMVKSMKVEFYKHTLTEECITEISDTARNLFITTGPKTALFETNFASYLGLPYSVGLMSCTHALHLAYKALGIGEGDEVIVPAYTFMATISPVIHAGAKPVLVDVNPDTGIIDPALIEKAVTKRTKAISPVNLYGVMAPMLQIKEIADKYKLHIVEDSAHCVEGRGPGFGPGTLSDAAAFSFYATKNITCGEGGALATNNEDVSKKVKILRNHGMDRNASERLKSNVQFYDIAEIGYKANMTDLHASLLLPQLNQISDFWEKRDRIVRTYNNELKNIGGIATPIVPDGYKSAHHLYTIKVTPPDKRDTFVAEMNNLGVGCSINYRPLTELSYISKVMSAKSSDYPNSTSIGNSVLTLPLYPSLKDAEVDQVIDTVKKIANRLL